MEHPSVRPTVRPSDAELEYSSMADESNLMPASRIVRWLTLAVLILLAIVLYFRDGLRLPRFGSTAAADSAAASAPTAPPATR